MEAKAQFFHSFVNGFKAERKGDLSAASMRTLQYWFECLLGACVHCSSINPVIYIRPCVFALISILSLVGEYISVNAETVRALIVVDLARSSLSTDFVFISESHSVTK